MAWKIYKEGNYIFVEDQDSMVLIEGLAKDVLINKRTLAGTDYKLHNMNGSIPLLPLADILKEDGSPYTQAEFESFYTIETGFNSASGGSGAVDLAGFMDYNDTTGSVSLVADTWTDIPNNGLGAFTNKLYKPDNVTELIDTSSAYIDVSELLLGESILIRNDYKINPNTNNSLVEFRYSLGTGAGEYTLDTGQGRLDSGSGKDYRFSLKVDNIYMGDTNTRDNPIKLQVKLSSNGTLTNSGSVITVLKR